MSSVLRKLRRRAASGHHVIPLRPQGIAPAGGKMSEVILDFAEPLVAAARTGEDFRKAIAIAIIFWDIALQPEEEHEELLGDAIRDLGEAAENDPAAITYFEAVGRALLLRKKVLFPDIKRAVLGYEVVGEGDSLQLLVTSTLAPPSPATQAWTRR